MIKVYKTIVVDLDTWRIIYNAARASLLRRHLYNHQDILTKKFLLVLERVTGLDGWATRTVTREGKLIEK